ncbi:siphovirus ReqiPepy6 Gp37-like family protein [Clostridium thailandense]|uniref:siphovirus ReqiPepy6 Gp37-like family protein n=1 Tax=Clostridium thailandense TaxID=2794346 RepID=UPI003989738E
MDLYVFDRELNFIGIVDIFSSLRWIRRHYKYGEFELQCALNSENLYLLQRENIIWKNDDLEAGYIEYRNLKQDQDGKEVLIVKGKFLTGYLNRRIILGQEILQDTAENVMRALVNKNCINSSDSNRIIPNLVLGDLKNYSSSISYQTNYKNLLDELEILGNANELGYRVKFDIQNKKLVFDIYKGLDKSVDQSINSPSIFAKEFENILEQEFTESINNYKNFGYVEGVNRVALVGIEAGLSRYETYIDGKSVESTRKQIAFVKDDNGDYQVIQYDAPIPDDEYLPMLREKGKSDLAGMCEVKTFDSKINVNSSSKYKVDFDLGDIVTCISKKWELTINTKITEIEEVYEEKGLGVNVTFGNNIPTLIDKIKQIVR